MGFEKPKSEQPKIPESKLEPEIVQRFKDRQAALKKYGPETLNITEREIAGGVPNQKMEVLDEDLQDVTIEKQPIKLKPKSDQTERGEKKAA